jgi:hypothetical protein
VGAAAVNDPDNARPHSPWWRYAAAAVLVFDGISIALYGPILPIPQWAIEMPFLGRVPWLPVIAGAALVVVGVGVARRRRWARVVGIVVALAYVALDLAAGIGSGSIFALLQALVPACVAFALASHWDGDTRPIRSVGYAR